MQQLDFKLTETAANWNRSLHQLFYPRIMQIRPKLSVTIVAKSYATSSVFYKGGSVFSIKRINIE